MEIKIDNSKSVNKTDLENKIKAMYKKVAEKPNDTYHFEMGRALALRLGYDPYILDLIHSSIKSMIIATTLLFADLCIE